MRSSAAVYLALRDLAAEYTYDALAVSDWPVFQNVMKIHPGMAFSWLDEQDRVPVASEGDVLGAISMLMMNEANAGQSLLLDMNDLDFEREAVLMWHCGGSPLGFADTQGVSWKNHSTLGRKTDAPPMGAVADYRFKPQLATLLRLGHDGKSLLAFDAEIIDSPHSGYEGSRGWLSHFQFDGQALKLADLVNTVMVEGIEHHFILGSGHQMAVFMEVAAWLNISVVRPVVYRDYLQRFSLYS
jgi:L-fucose isomerase-like protein